MRVNYIYFKLTLGYNPKNKLKKSSLNPSDIEGYPPKMMLFTVFSRSKLRKMPDVMGKEKEVIYIFGTSMISQSHHKLQLFSGGR